MRTYKFAKLPLLLLLVALYITTFVMTSRTAIMRQSIEFGTLTFEYGRLCSVLTVLEILIATLMVVLFQKTGRTLANILFTMSFCFSSIPVVTKQRLDSVPGIVLILFGMIVVNLLYGYINRLNHLADTDELTGLPNRRALYKHLRQRARSRVPFALILIDLDNFKMVNDTAGHDCGDILLREIASRWKLSRHQKNSFFSRIGGDEFVLVADIATTKEALVETVRQSLLEGEHDHVFIIRNIDFYVSASIGICFYPDDTKSVDKLTQYADMAMYQIKLTQKQGVSAFHTDMLEAVQRNFSIEQEIRAALDNNGLFLNFQPQYHLDSHMLRGFETLVRMRDAEDKPISPGRFIPTAEKSILIVQIDRWVLRNALLQFQPHLPQDTDVLLSVNISVRFMLSEDFLSYVDAVLQETGFPAKNLELEITESLLIHSPDGAVKVLAKLRARGIHIALDDFGTGYSSLSYLRILPLDLLKIDKAFIDAMAENEKNRDFVAAIIAMGHLLDLTVISEGVENEKQLQQLASFGCDMIQGYAWGKPLCLPDAVACIPMPQAVLCS